MVQLYILLSKEFTLHTFTALKLQLLGHALKLSRDHHIGENHASKLQKYWENIKASTQVIIFYRNKSLHVKFKCPANFYTDTFLVKEFIAE
jgi:hypothetical protein